MKGGFWGTSRGSVSGGGGAVGFVGNANNVSPYICVFTMVIKQ